MLETQGDVQVITEGIPAGQVIYRLPSRSASSVPPMYLPFDRQALLRQFPALLEVVADPDSCASDPEADWHWVLDGGTWEYRPTEGSICSACGVEMTRKAMIQLLNWTEQRNPSCGYALGGRKAGQMGEMLFTKETGHASNG